MNIPYRSIYQIPGSIFILEVKREVDAKTSKIFWPFSITCGPDSFTHKFMEIPNPRTDTGWLAPLKSSWLNRYTFMIEVGVTQRNLIAEIEKATEQPYRFINFLISRPLVVSPDVCYTVRLCSLSEYTRQWWIYERNGEIGLVSIFEFGQDVIKQFYAGNEIVLKLIDEVQKEYRNFEHEPRI
jgi:hypothetical protein